MTFDPGVSRSSLMPVRDALQVLIRYRTDDQVVITNQGSARIWPLLDAHELDFHYNPSAMGGAVPLALGLALARPDLKVIVVTGDGALLMNLGCLISVVAAGATNLTVVVLDNGVYEVTGGQQTAASHIGVDYARLASSVGFPATSSLHHLTEWERAWPDMLSQSGPRLVSLQVEAAHAADLNSAAIPLQSQLKRFRQRLAASP